MIAQPSARPIQRSALRLLAGRLYYRTRRHLDWLRQSSHFATTRQSANLPYRIASHATPLLRPLKDVDMWLQHNKVINLSRAVPCLDGLVLNPGQILSYWYLIGAPTRRNGYVPGMILRNGTVKTGIGGGLCQLSNLIYWITLHTPLTVRERWRHGYDVFPDAGRTQPFGSGATCAYNHIDLQIENPTAHPLQLRLWMDGNNLHGEWRGTIPPQEAYRIREDSHRITSEWWGGYMRHNTIVRDVFTPEANAFIRQEFVTENHAVMMYNPLLPG
jgi:vancomycin resistance protein VanW